MDRLDQILANKQTSSSVQGEWYAIQWTPDIASKETLNIGVAYKDSLGEVSIKMLDYFDRIACLYSKNMIFQLELACEVSRSLILKKGLAQELTHQIKCDLRGFAQGKTAADVVEQLYDSVITLGKKVRTHQPRSFSSVSRDSLYNNLRVLLKQNLSLDYSKHVPENPYETIAKQHEIYLPYRKNNGVATLATAAYADIQRVKCNLFEGYRDLDVATQHHKPKSSAFFLLLPGDELKKDKQIEIENELDKFTWHLNQHNIKVHSHVSQESLGEDISNWCLSAA
ncbi:hypothetical protein HNW13_000055 [Shewanella sp. BF02_Schw]|uniref:hypothetical protein n=1 Tax=Shewanella sp. BF02_Schw TaxID=394908 RepID=UPI001781EDDF|nr:hypothetical protein [Shewanella sp. BF02_Schw]MBO1894197.1 hypothetical protein [Shewanella sp. BF02_Schw]